MSILIEKDAPKNCSDCAAFYKKLNRSICKLIPTTKDNEDFNADKEIMEDCPLIIVNESKWIKMDDEGGFYYVCENCRNLSPFETEYCSYCGSRMIKDELNDFISRQIVLDNLRALIVNPDEIDIEEDPESIKKYNNGVYNSIAVINNLPPIEALKGEPAKEETTWISCADELPPQNQIVLIYMKDRIEFGQYDDEKWYWLFESGMDYWEEADNVEKWMPLPTKGIKDNK